MHAFRRQYYFHSLAVIIDSIYLPHPTQPPHLISEPISERPLPQSLSSSGSRSVQETRPTDQPRGRRAFLLKAARGWNGGSGDGRFRLCSSEENPLGRSFNLLSSPPSLGRAGRRARRSRGVLCWSVACFSFTARISLGKVASRPAMRAGHPTFMSSK